MIKKLNVILLAIFLFPLSLSALAEGEDTRTFVEMTPEMQQEFLSNMRGHMISLDAIIAALACKDLEKAAEIADYQLGMKKQHQCEQHENQHKGVEHNSVSKKLDKEVFKKGFGSAMPPEMKAMGMQLHHAASNFATVVKKGDQQESLKALQKISSACVACHQSFRVQ